MYDEYNSLAPWHFFTQEVNNVIDLAYIETQHLGHKEIATVQLLLGLIRQEQGLAAQVLKDAGVNLENARLEVEKIQGRGAGYNREIPYNQHTRAVFELSKAEADQLKDSEIDTEHLLLGLLRQSEGGAIKVLQNLGVDPTQLQNQVYRKLVEQGHPTASQFLPVPTPVNSNETNQNKDDVAVIQKILQYPEGPEFIESMASMLEQQGDTKGAQVLRGLITPRTEETADNLETPTVNVSESIKISSPAEVPDSIESSPRPKELKPISSSAEVEVTKPDSIESSPRPKDLKPVVDVPTLSNQELEKFLYQLLRVSFESKADEQVVNNFLRENLDKLSDRYPEVLHNWADTTLPKLGDSQKQELLKRITFISSLIRKFDGGVQETNLEIALTGYNIVASILTPVETPKDWAIIHNCLGLTYLERVQGEQVKNLEQAIAYFNVALDFYNQEQFPEQRKIILENVKKARTKLRNILEEEQEIPLSSSSETLPSNQVSPEIIPEPGGRGLFELFSDKAIKAIMLAQEECRRIGDNFVGTEKILLGLIGEATGVAAQTLKSLGINLKDTRIEVEKIIGRGLRSVEAEIPFTPRAKRVLELAITEADQLGDKEITTEHLLLSLVREEEGVAARVLENMGVDLSQVRSQVLGIRKGGEFDGFSNKLIQGSLSKNKEQTITHQNPERSQKYLYLIEELLRSPQSQHESILDDNSELLDSGLIEMMRQRAKAEKNRDNIQNAELLINLVQKLTEKFHLSSSEPTGFGFNLSPNFDNDTKTGTEEKSSLGFELLAVDNNTTIGKAEVDNNTTIGKAEKVQVNSPGNQIDIILSLFRGAEDFTDLLLNFFFDIMIGGPEKFNSGLAEQAQEQAKKLKNQGKLDEAKFLQQLTPEMFQAFELDSSFIKYSQQFKQMAANLKEIGVKNVPKLMIKFTKLVMVEANKNQNENIENYMIFLQELLETIYQCEAEPRVVYPLLENNLDKLNDNLVTIWQIWFNSLLPEVGSNVAEELALLNIFLGDLIKDFPKGDQSANLEIVIATFEIANKVLMPDKFPEECAKVKKYLGLAYFDRERGEKRKNYEISIQYLQQSLKIYKEKDLTLEREQVNFNLGLVYFESLEENKGENYKLAINYFQSSLTVFTRKDFPEEWAGINAKLGIIYTYRHIKKATGNIEIAIKYFQGALKVYNPRTYPEEWVNTLMHLGMAYLDLNQETTKNPEKAIYFFKKILQVCNFESEPQKWAVIQGCIGLAYIHRREGIKADNLELAIDYIKEGLNKVSPGTSPKFFAEANSNLALAYLERIRGGKAENIEMAINHALAALDIFTPSESPESLAKTHNILGGAYSDRVRDNRTKNLELAIKHYSNALEIFTAENDREHMAMVQHNLSSVHMDCIEESNSENLETAETAIKYCLEALKVRTRENYPQQWANTQHNLGKAYSHKNNFAEEIKSYFNALEIFKFEEFPEQWAMVNYSLGKTYLQRSWTDDCSENLKHGIDYLENALKVYKFEEFPQQYAEIQGFLGMVYQYSTETEKSYKAFTQCIHQVHSIRGEIIKGSGLEADKQKIAEHWHLIYQSLIEVCIDEKKLEEAIKYVELSKARNLVELFTNRNILPKGNFSEEVIADLTRIRREIVNERIFYSNKRNGGRSEIMLNQGSEYFSSTPVNAGNRLNSLQQELDKLIREKIAPIDPDFVFTQQVQSISYPEIQKVIPDEKTVIIEFYITNDTIHTFIISKQSDKPTHVPYTLKNVRSLFDFCFNRNFRDYSEQKEMWEKKLSMRLQQLSGILDFDEIISQIPTECDNLIVIPHRFIHLLPIHALPLKKGGCLMEHFSRGVRYAPSCQLLQLSTNQHNQSFDKLFAIQNPDQTLSFADIEVKAISSLFLENNIQILAKQDATKPALFEIPMQEKLRQAHCVHFSCHGTFKLESSWESALTLADSNFTLGEIFNLKLPQCRLVTLSACETGVIDFNNLSDEYIGLPSGFLYAGASNVVATLWTVNDLSTTFLMIKLYENLHQQLKETNELNVALALRNAQLWLKQVDKTQLEKWLPNIPLKKRNHKAELKFLLKKIKPNTQPFKSPYYWAGFCAIGQ